MVDFSVTIDNELDWWSECALYLHCSKE